MEKTSHPYIFDEFFASGKEESISPFLTPSSRSWGKNLPLKSAGLSAVLLAASFTTSFFHPTLSQLLLALVYFLCGTPALIDAVSDLRNLEINIDVLMTLAALLSVIIGSGMEGALLLVLFELSASMENAVTQKTKGALLNLNQLSPRTACVIGDDGILFERSVREITIGTQLLVKAGEVVPLDGEVKAGSSFVNMVHLTGESQPIPKTIGNDVPAGARNLDGTLTISVTRTSSDSTLSRIVQLITQAQEAKPQIQKFLDHFGKWYATSIILLAAAFALTLPFFLGIPYLGPEGGIYRALAFLIAASPCALIIATPTAYLSAISSCASKGILLKGGVILDALSKCSIIAFDKTGTLTTGKLACTSLEPLTATVIDEKTALSIAAALERHAVHPIAEAITSLANSKKVTAAEIKDFKSTAGFGLEGKVKLGEKEVTAYIGHADFISSKLSSELKSQWQELKTKVIKEGKLSTLLLIDNSLYLFHFTDAIRPQVKEVLSKLKEDHLKLVMLTGDHKENADFVAKELGIDEVYSDLRPEDKLAKVAELSQKDGLIMVGDGVNDAPALARASVGISMGRIGSATAVDASDVVLLHDDFDRIDWLLRKSKKTLQIVKQNLTLALGVILCATTPTLLGLIPLWLAVILHEGGTVLVGFNSLRLLKR